MSYQRALGHDAMVNAQDKSSEALALAAGNAKGTSVDCHLSTLVVKLQLLIHHNSRARPCFIIAC
jgi:hypothetical protein